MAIFMNNNLLDCMAELKDADYSRQPKLDSVYKRLLKGRKQFPHTIPHLFHF